MKKRLKLSPNMEDYLEAILLIKNKKRVVRVRDIAKAKGVAFSSVNSALKTLAKLLLIEHDRYEFVDFTPKGNIIAKKIYNRHLILTKFLKDILGVDKKTAEEDACKMEHTLSPKSLDRLIKFMEFLKTCSSEEKFFSAQGTSVQKKQKEKLRRRKEDRSM